MIHSFQGGSDGSNPWAGLTIDAAGNLYGTTNNGGGTGCSNFGCGTVFKIAPDGTETVIHSFGSGSDGTAPTSGVIEDAAGNLYGMTYAGGANQRGGTIFMIAPNGTETVLYSFCSQKNCADGSSPYGDLIRNDKGDLFGTTSYGGSQLRGVVFKLSPSAKLTVLYAFASGSDGATPVAGLVRGPNGELFGTTELGGDASGNCPPDGDQGFYCGTVFELAHDGTETLLHVFQGAPDGGYPMARLLRLNGIFYGTTYYGGVGGNYGGGTVFTLTADGSESVLYAFQGAGDGASPSAELVADRKNILYGTTEYGGTSDKGTLFALTLGGTETILHTFTGGSDGGDIRAGLLLQNGYLYGTTYSGGVMNSNCSIGCGVVFRIKK